MSDGDSFELERRALKKSAEVAWAKFQKLSKHTDTLVSHYSDTVKRLASKSGLSADDVSAIHAALDAIRAERQSMTSTYEEAEVACRHINADIFGDVT